MRRKRSTLILALLLVVIGIARTAHAGPQAGGWMLLGTSHVDGKSDHDKIKCGDTGTFRAIQLRVSDLLAAPQYQGPDNAGRFAADCVTGKASPGLFAHWRDVKDPEEGAIK